MQTRIIAPSIGRLAYQRPVHSRRMTLAVHLSNAHCYSSRACPTGERSSAMSQRRVVRCLRPNPSLSRRVVMHNLAVISAHAKSTEPVYSDTSLRFVQAGRVALPLTSATRPSTRMAHAAADEFRSFVRCYVLDPLLSAWDHGICSGIGRERRASSFGMRTYSTTSASPKTSSTSHQIGARKNDASPRIDAAMVNNAVMPDACT